MIKFGTSGWRAITSDEFTFNNVRLVTQAIADFIKSRSSNPKSARKAKSQSQKVIVGYDTRFLSKEFAQASAEILVHNGIDVFKAYRDVPTPVVAFHIMKSKAAGGINITASHNPPQYNGLKFSPSYGGPAGADVTSWIEKRISQLGNKSRRTKLYALATSHKPLANIREFDPAPAYLARVRSLVDMKAIKKARLKVVVDCLYGTSRGYLDMLLREAGCDVKVVNDKVDPMFGGKRPEPNGENLHELMQLVKSHKADIGLATDPDADRFGIVDKGGRYISANEIICVLFSHLVNTRPVPKDPVVARTSATTHMIDEIAAHHNVGVRETPVGFKFIGPVISEGNCIIGGEESGGLSVRGHVPEKDGILACMLACEAIAINKKSISGILNSLEHVTGKFYNTSINLHADDSTKKALIGNLERAKEKLGNFRILDVSCEDGYRFILEHGDWIMFRQSGTEPLVRTYIEARSQARFNALKKLVYNLIPRSCSQ